MPTPMLMQTQSPPTQQTQQFRQPTTEAALLKILPERIQQVCKSKKDMYWILATEA